jgi:O-acetyl-ADP-ribose deacetylase (regulator of RNase III)
MTDKLHVFISYKKLEGSVTPAYATNIAAYLEQYYGVEVFIDIEKMHTGEDWARRIYSEIQQADALILLLEPNTANSEWVQREVDFARGANVALLPLLVVDRTTVNIDEAVKKLALASIQHSRHFQQRPEDYDALAADIRRLAIETRTAQRQHARQRERHWYALPTDALKQKQRTYRLKDGKAPNLTICLTVGNILDMPPGSLDAIVNSENDYLQMARFFEVNTLSARLRRFGAWFDKGRLREDTVQQELLQRGGDSLPIPLRQVIATSAGHVKGDLRRVKKIKVILHAITVQFDVGNIAEPVRSFNSDDAFQETVRECLLKVDEVNQDAAFRESIDPEFKEIRSIAVPMFGTGMGGRSIQEIASHMVRGMHRALLDVGAFSLREIHLLVYSPYEVGPVQEALDDTLDLAEQNP